MPQHHYPRTNTIQEHKQTNPKWGTLLVQPLTVVGQLFCTYPGYSYKRPPLGVDFSHSPTVH